MIDIIQIVLLGKNMECGNQRKQCNVEKGDYSMNIQMYDVTVMDHDGLC